MTTNSATPCVSLISREFMPLEVQESKILRLHELNQRLENHKIHSKTSGFYYNNCVNLHSFVKNQISLGRRTVTVTAISAMTVGEVEFLQFYHHNDQGGETFSAIAECMELVTHTLQFHTQKIKVLPALAA